MKFLKLHLSGVLQYYASQNSATIRGNYRTELYPTRDAIIGLVGSALGIPRNDNQLKQLQNELTIKYQDLSKFPSVLTDFQTIKPLKSQNRFMNRQKPVNKFITAGGGTNSENILKKVQYLQDAEFNVFIGGQEELLKNIYDAIKNPVYALYLGKRSCIPNKPLVTEFKLIDEGDLTDVYDCI